MKKVAKRPLNCFECGNCRISLITKDGVTKEYTECYYSKKQPIPISIWDRCHHGLTIIDE